MHTYVYGIGNSTINLYFYYPIFKYNNNVLEQNEC